MNHRQLSLIALRDQTWASLRSFLPILEKWADTEQVERISSDDWLAIRKSLLIVCGDLHFRLSESEEVDEQS